MYHLCIDIGRQDARALLAVNVRTARKRALLTQHGLATLSQVSRPTIARIERGDWLPQFRTVRKLAAALNVEPEALVPDPAQLWLD